MRYHILFTKLASLKKRDSVLVQAQYTYSSQTLLVSLQGGISHFLSGELIL